jgi:ribose 5-phosphate isomerase B
MKISMGSDHGGYDLKSRLKDLLEQRGIEVSDLGCHGTESVDYPDYAHAVAKQVAAGETDRGILVCTTGIGVSITANRLPGIRASLCHNEEMAELTRLHNNSNVLCLSQKFTTAEDAAKILDIWLNTEFEGGRHERRVLKIDKCEVVTNGSVL